MNFGKSGNINSYDGLEMYIYDNEKIGSLFITNFDVSLDINTNTSEILENSSTIPFNRLNSLFIFKFNIDDKYRRMGYGTNLLNETVKFCNSIKIKYIYLNCDLSNKRAKKLYDKFGFIELGKNKSPTPVDVLLKESVNNREKFFFYFLYGSYLVSIFVILLSIF
jgi:RimJ/RimL family protein N-acetyltransferase